MIDDNEPVVTKSILLMFIFIHIQTATQDAVTKTDERQWAYRYKEHFSNDYLCCHTQTSKQDALMIGDGQQ